MVESLGETLHEELGQPKPGKALTELKAMLLVEQVIAVRVIRGESADLVLEAFLYDMRSSQLLFSSTIEVQSRTFEDRRTRVVKLVQALTQMESIEVDPAQGSTLPRMNDSLSMTQKWWFWPGVGVVAAGVLTTMLVILAEGDEATGQGGILLRF